MNSITLDAMSERSVLSLSVPNSEHEAQLFNYLRVSRMQVGYLLNFGAASKLEWKRFIISNQ